MLLTIVVPVFNEESTVGQVLERLRGIDYGLPKEIIAVNDGSSDGTAQALNATLAAWPLGGDALRVHHSPCNLGKGSSVRIGFSLSRGDVIAIQDADLELDPNDLRPLINLVASGEAQVAYGSRFANSGVRGRLAFYAANRALAGLTNLLYGSSLSDIETCYKVLHKDVLGALKLRGSRFEIEPEITAQVLRAGFQIVERPIGYQPRTAAQGKKISWRDGFGAVYTLFAQRIGK